MNLRNVYSLMAAKCTIASANMTTVMTSSTTVTTVGFLSCLVLLAGTHERQVPVQRGKNSDSQYERYRSDKHHQIDT